MPQTTTVDPDIRPISLQEFPEFYRLIAETFGGEVRDADVEADQFVFEPERSLAVFDGDLIVGTSAIFSRALTAPGAVQPVAGVTMVSVAPTHRRRGLLTAMMRRQLTELFETSGESVAALWASEAGIYGRFGYGLASRRARLTARSQRLTLRPDIDRGTGRIRQATVEQARPHLESVYERQRQENVGWLDRRDRWWDYVLYDPEHARRGATPLRVALHEETDGTVTGYVRYRVKHGWADSEPNNEILVRDLVGTTTQATAALWHYLTQLDLARHLDVWARPLDEQFQHMVTDPYAVQLSVTDNLWVRLVDVGRALAGRRYAREIDVVLDVTDEFCPWNVGRWRLGGGPKNAQCSRTPDAAEVVISSTDLGAVYLGGTTVASLAATGRITELRPGAVAELSQAMRHDREPWCPEIF